MTTTTSHFLPLSPTVKIHAVISTPTATPQTPVPAIVCLHYWGGSAQTFHRLFSLLSPPDTVISLSHRGWGQSIGPADSDAYSIAQLARDVLNLLSHLAPYLKGGFVLLGHSMGAKVAIAVAGQNPVGLKGMVLVGPAPPGPLVLPAEMRQQQGHAYESEESVRWTVENVLTHKRLGDGDVGMVLMDSLAGNRWAREAWVGSGMGEDVGVGLDGRGMRVEVVVGREDRVESVERVEREVVNVLREKGFSVEFTVEEECGHLMPLEKPEAVANAVNRLIGGL